MNLFSLLNANQNTAIGTMPWGTMAISMVNLQLDEDKQVGPATTGRALVELIFNLDARKRQALLTLDIPLDDDDPQNTSPNAGGKLRKYILIFAGSLLVLMIVLVSAYVAMTTIEGQTPNSGAMEQFFNFMGQILTWILNNGQ